MDKNSFTETDLAKISEHGISLEVISSQIEKFKSGSPYSSLTRSAVLGSGIFDLNEFDKEKLLSFYDEAVKNGRISKFVPASGAATRMFKDLLEFYYSHNAIMNNNCQQVFSEINNFPFYNDLKNVLANNSYDINDLLAEKNYKLILEYILFEKGLNYSNLPKALLKFSKFEDRSATALEEHYNEGLDYASDKNNNINLHFTVSEEHEAQIKELSNTLVEKFLPAHKFNVSFSNQNHNTDTIAVDENNKPFRDKNNNILLRPGGHGALIHNLNSLDGDIVFIKNIDNVQSRDNDLGSNKEPNENSNLSIYKKLLAGILLTNQTKIFEYIELLQNNNFPDLSEIEKFIVNNLNIYLNDEYFKRTSKEKTDHLISLLIRPIRVCGMVKNTGAPGGGPFYVRKNNDVSLQIVESSQINLTKEDQKNIFTTSTHFNPVDIVCGLRDRDEDNYNLLNYIDHDSYFISNKSVDGKPLKALELPGLWNGAMADWITIFVEVPLGTFTPVKTINDLL